MSATVLLIDNYDSFVYNLARYLQELGLTTVVVRNDAMSVDEIRRMAPDAIVLSPGPCTPTESGISLEVVRDLYNSIPILGVCLGHQAIAVAFGGKILQASEPVHGRTSEIRHNGTELFEDCPNPLTVARYHSLIIESASLPDSLVVTSQTEDGTMMSLQHRTAPCYGVQFHPESILTVSGHQLLKNFLKLAGLVVSHPNPHGDLMTENLTENDFYQREIAADARRPL